MIEIFTQITGTGTAESDYEHAGFSLTTSALDKTGPAAKAKVVETTGRIRGALKTLESEGIKLVANSLQTSLSVSAETVYNDKLHRSEHVGYRAQYTCTFSTPDLDRVSMIHDVLTSIEDVVASSPNFKTTQLDTAKKAARAAAGKDAREKLSALCEIADIPVTNLEIVNIVYGGTSIRVIGAPDNFSGYRAIGAQGVTGPQGAQGSPGVRGPIEIARTKAEVSETVTLSYVRKP